MKKGILLLGLIVLLIPGCGFPGQTPVFKEGVYPLKAKTLTYFELSSKGLDLMANMAELTETKPDDLTVDFDYAKLDEVRFGSFRFGNNKQKTWFLIGKDPSGYWSYFYLDQNLDHHLTKQDKIILQAASGTYKEFKTHTTLTEAPISITVSYKGATKNFTKQLYFFIDIEDYSKNDLHDTLVKAFTATFFEGTIPVMIGQNWRFFDFRLIDANSNGCFNDYGRDIVNIDKNNDGSFLKNQSYELVEYFDSVDQDKQQMQVIIPPYPAKIAITKVNQIFDLTTLEPELDQSAPAVSTQNSKPDQPAN